MGIPERRAREREARRKAVLDAARALVRERGLNGTTTRLIAEHCELSEATLFWYFDSKDEIFTSLLHEGIDFMVRGVGAIAESDAEPVDKLRRLWRFFAEVRDEHPEYLHVFAYLAQPQSTAAVSDEVKAETLRRSEPNFRRFADIIRAAAPGANARLVADLLWGAFLGMTLLRDSRENLGARPRPDDRDLSAALRLLLGGIVPGAGNGTSRSGG